MAVRESSHCRFFFGNPLRGQGVSGRGAKQRVNSLIQSGVDEGVQLLLNGRKVKGYDNGNFLGPTIIGNVTVSLCVLADDTL